MPNDLLSLLILACTRLNRRGETRFPFLYGKRHLIIFDKSTFRAVMLRRMDDGAVTMSLTEDGQPLLSSEWSLSPPGGSEESVLVGSNRLSAEDAVKEAEKILLGRPG